MAGSSPYAKKTLWEKEKLLVTSSFSFSRSVFKRVLLQTRKNQGLLRKRLNDGLIIRRLIGIIHYEGALSSLLSEHKKGSFNDIDEGGFRYTGFVMS